MGALHILKALLSKKGPKTIRQRRHNSSVLVLILVLAPVPFRNVGDRVRINDSPLVRLGESVTDQVLDCIHRVYNKSVLRDASASQELLINSCPDSRARLAAALESRGIRAFESGDFIFLIPAKLFPPRPSDLSPYIKTLTWQAIKIVPVVKPSPDISDALNQDIKKWVFQKARLIPLEVSLLPINGTEVQVNINVYVLVGRLTSNGTRPVVAWINALPTFLTGRLVYGEIRNDLLTMLWESPLFNAYGQVYFKDVVGDGLQEVVIQSQDCGNECSDAIVIFDRNGRELTRQARFDRFSEVFDEKDGVVAIKGREIDVEPTPKGSSDIVVRGWSVDNKNHVFRIKNGMFVPSPRTNPKGQN